MSQLNKGSIALTEESVQEPSAALATSNDSSATEELIRLRREIIDWRGKAEELEQQLVTANQVAQDRWVELQREYETLIEEKSETIRTLHHKYTELRERSADSPAATAPDGAGDGPPDRQDLLRLQQEVKEQRRKMEEDEQSIMGQLRQMEMALARDRAELARQRAELQRLHDELKHEAEVSSRDSGLRQRLGALQRVATSATLPRSSSKTDTPPPGELPTVSTSTSQPGTPSRSGLFRRIFGSGIQKPLG
jgi:DNA repair exonuclease SbcCD ATPase subunit